MPLPDDRARGWIATLAVTALAAVPRFWHLGYPNKLLFDETYYAKDAWSLVHHGYVTDYVANANQRITAGHLTHLWTDTPSMVVHPEVGKWIIGAFEWVFGMNSLGWRLAPAVFGTLMVLVMVRLVRRLSGSTLMGVLAGLLMAADGLQLVLSRLALLDIFEAFFILCAVSAMVCDRDWMRERIARLDEVVAAGPRLLWRPWLFLAGSLWGLGLGTKWGTVFVLAACGLLFWSWCTSARREAGVPRAWLRSAFLDAFPGLGYLVLLPLVVYVLTWTGWLLHAHVYEQALSNTQYGPYWGRYLQADTHGFFPNLVRSLRSLWHYHHDVYEFHTKFLDNTTHIYQSNPIGWPILNRPVGVDAVLDIKPGHGGCTAPAGSTCLRQILLLGNPALWWGGCLALLWGAWAWLKRRDWRYGLAVLGFVAGWLPWLPNADRPIFSYYAIVMEPFLVLALVLALRDLRRALPPTWGTTLVIGYTALVIAMFAWFWPVDTDGLLTNAQWLQRIWFKRWM